MAYVCTHVPMRTSIHMPAHMSVNTSTNVHTHLNHISMYAYVHIDAHVRFCHITMVPRGRPVVQQHLNRSFRKSLLPWPVWRSGLHGLSRMSWHIEPPPFYVLFLSLHGLAFGV
jgi:hypothetical protein